MEWLGYHGQRQKRRKRTTNFGTWNTQGISGKTNEIAVDLEKHNIGIVNLTETKKKGQATERAEIIYISSAESPNMRELKEECQ